MSSNDGGPAFPTPALETIVQAQPDEPVDFHTVATGIREGMSLRDWFAGMAVTGIINDDGAKRKAAEQGVEGPEAIAYFAYKLADAMLRAREEQAE